MTSLLIDSGFLFAIIVSNDPKHSIAMKVLESLKGNNLVLPTPVIIETMYLLQARIGHHAARNFLKVLMNSPWKLENIHKTDLERIYELLNQYSDAELDFVDAAITTLAERLGITQILTVDQRDFRLIKPSHCDYFEILPDS